MRWHWLGGKWVARLESFDDSWKALASFPELITELEKQDGKGMTDDIFVTILMQLGFRDLTNYKDPDLKEVCPKCGQPIGGKS